MGSIVLLDELTINQMAAGEVIERPANVVKELVENSLDAGAKKIVVEIKNGGKTFIKVVDNGKGMTLEDMPVALERHATSKITRVEDLQHTYTMGFRGEALASIASISKLTMISKTADNDTGVKLVSQAGDIIDAQDVGAPTGTTIIVENLFFNTPVRYKFLKQDGSEFKYIKDWIQKCALANPDVSFTLKSDGKDAFRSNGSGNLREIVYTIYGRDISENLLDVNYDYENIKITGVIGNTLISRDTRKEQIVFLNKRNIKNPTITSSIDQAYKGGGVGIGKFGFAIVNLEMPADLYDVNVHPTKMEVRFNDEQKVYKALYSAIKETLLTKEFLGNTENQNNKEYVEDEYKFQTSNFGIEEYKNENTEVIKRKEKRKIDYKYIGIMFKTFIAVEIDGELYLIDQHAAHERILYEEIKTNYRAHIQNDTQMMLVPEVLNLSNKEMEFVKANEDMFKRLGFDIDYFGDTALKINGIPNLDYKTNSKNLFLDVLDEMITNERSTIKDVEERFIATVACKAAVKAGMDLSLSEVDYLIQNLLNLSNPYTCPHGRPTTIRMNKDDFKM